MTSILLSDQAERISGLSLATREVSAVCEHPWSSYPAASQVVGEGGCLLNAAVGAHPSVSSHRPGLGSKSPGDVGAAAPGTPLEALWEETPPPVWGPNGALIAECHSRSPDAPGEALIHTGVGSCCENPSWVRPVWLSA